MLRAYRALLLAAGFAVVITVAGSGCFPPPRPGRAPAGHVRKRPPKPHPNAIWVKGHYKRNPRGGTRVWVKGHWKTPAKSQTKAKEKKQTQTREKKQTQIREEEQTQIREDEQTKMR